MNYNDLPEHIQKRAVKNLETQSKDNPGYIKACKNNFKSDISGWFSWRITPEGVDYWAAVAMGVYDLAETYNLDNGEG